jgi:ABC-2 type transport system ATP-binding protein
VLKTEDLTVHFRGKIALDQVNLEVTEPGVIGVFGQNGAGKTTLFRCIAGLQEKYSGRISTEGSPVLLVDHPVIYPFLTVAEGIRLFGSLFRDFDSEVAAQIVERLRFPSERRVGQLSKGMLEQYSLALALARRAHLYLMDEPLASVDPLTRDVLISMIQEFRPPDAAVLISTHLIAGLETLFDSLIIVHDGRILASRHVDAELLGGGLEILFKELIANV